MPAASPRNTPVATPAATPIAILRESVCAEAFVTSRVIGGSPLFSGRDAVAADDGCHVVIRSAVIGSLDQRGGGLFERPRRFEDPADISVADGVGQPVRAQQHGVPVGQLDT